MLYDDMILSRFMVYAQSIEDSKLGRIARNIKRGGSSDQCHPRFKKKISSQDESRVAKVKHEKGSGSQEDKLTCFTCG